MLYEIKTRGQYGLSLQPGKQLSESGHNDEASHQRTTLVLRGTVEGTILALAVLSLAEYDASFAPGAICAPTAEALSGAPRKQRATSAA